MYNDAAREAIYRWRERHEDEWRKYHNRNETERYRKNKCEILAKKKENYEYSRFLNNTNTMKEFSLFCKIDI
jgi:hypothetical protein